MIRSLRQIFQINYDKIRSKKISICRAVKYFEGILMLKKHSGDELNIEMNNLDGENTAADVVEIIKKDEVVKDELEELKRDVRKARPTNFEG